MKSLYRFLVASAVLAASTSWAVIGGGEVTFHVNGAKDVRYSHEFHVLKKGLKCSECHNALFTTRVHHFKMTMVDMQKGKSCGSCHNGQRTFTVRSNCARCHSGA